MWNSPLDDLAKKIDISSTSPETPTFFKVKQEFTNIFQNVSVKLEGLSYRLSQEFTLLRIIYRLYVINCVDFDDLFLLDPVEFSNFSCAENTFEWTSWKTIWQNMAFWVWFISSQPFWVLCTLVDIRKLIFSCCSSSAPFEITVVFLP